ncbi:MAG: sugar phosphate nucleotidyltransferase, partial [Saprospiraceae bacterium]
MQALVFAAGLGTRLRPYTDNRPKALVPVGGTPLLDHCLRRLAAAGCTRAVVNVHYFANQIEDYLSATDFG